MIQFICKLCDKLKFRDELEIVDGNLFCKNSEHKDIKSCAEIQEDYIQFMHTRERPE